MPQSGKKEPKLLTLKQACEILNCHPNTLRAWDAKVYLIAVRFARGDRRYRKEDVMKLLGRNNGKQNTITDKNTINDKMFLDAKL